MVTSTETAVPEVRAAQSALPSASFWAGNPALLGYPVFVLGSIALGLALVGFVPANAKSSVLPIVIAASGIGVFVSALWSIALGQGIPAAIFGLFAGFWLSYSLLVLGLIHGWYAIPASSVAKSQELFLLSWAIIMASLTAATLRLPAAYPVLLGLVTLSLVLVYISTAEASPSVGKAGGVVALLFAAQGLYMFLGEASSATGGRSYPLGRPLVRS